MNKRHKLVKKKENEVKTKNKNSEQLDNWWKKYQKPAKNLKKV